jgi:hypothetical protein
MTGQHTSQHDGHAPGGGRTERLPEEGERHGVAGGRMHGPRPLRYRDPRRPKQNNMKLATLKDGSRDGQLLVVSRDLCERPCRAGIAPTLQRALDDWAFVSPQLEDLYQTLNEGQGAPRVRVRARTLRWRRCRAPTSGPTARPT